MIRLDRPPPGVPAADRRRVGVPAGDVRQQPPLGQHRPGLVDHPRHHQPQRQRRAGDLDLLLVAAGGLLAGVVPRRPVQDHGRLGDADRPGPGPDRDHLGPAPRVEHLGERAGQPGDHLAQLALAAPVQDDALAVGADDEPVAGGVPAAVMADRVGLAVDDVDRRAAQPPALGRGHHVVELVDVPRRQGGPAEPGGEHARGGAEAELHRPQRAAVVGVDDQGGAQLVAQVGVVGPDIAVALRRGAC